MHLYFFITVPTYPALKPCILCEGSSWYTNLDQHYQAKHTESVSIDEAATESMAKTVKANFIEERMLASFCQIVSLPNFEDTYLYT